MDPRKRLAGKLRIGWFPGILLALAGTVTLPLLVPGASGGDVPSSTTVLLVRHAERNSGEDALNPVGQARAKALARIAADAKLDAIYVTEYKRTQQTAAPLAEALDLAPTQIAGADVQAVADHILANHSGERVLVVGHSNTVPQIIHALGGPAMENLSEDAYDNLFVVTRFPDGAELLHLHYGEPSSD